MRPNTEPSPPTGEDYQWNLELPHIRTCDGPENEINLIPIGNRRLVPYILLCLAVLILPALAQAAGSEWYFSWGYNRDFWAPSSIHVVQPALNNDFTVHDVKATDFAQWNDSGYIFDKGITVPQFNIRYGWFLESQHEYALEFSIDHTKYNTTIGQTAHVSGMINGLPVDQDSVLTSDYFNYRLHNGANHIMLSLVKRTPLIGELNQSLSLSLLLKGGAGVMIPHAESTIFGKESDVGPKKASNAFGVSSGWWQLAGWTTGGEVAARFVFARPFFFELSDKVAYAHLWNVPVYQGRADQSLWMNAVLFAFGITTNDQNNGP